jgi:molybdate transport system permease protein
LTQIPGSDAAAARLVLISLTLAFAALFASEWLSRRAAIRFHGD